MGRLERLPARVVALAHVAGFLLIHLAYYVASGLRFDASPPRWYWQFLDPDLLTGDLWRSLFYLHAQPPLFNLVVGLGLQACGEWSTECFHALYVALGYGLYAAQFVLMRRLGVGRAIAFAVSTAFVASPAFMLYGHWLFYPLPLAALLTLSAVALHRALSGGGWGAATAFALTLLVVAGVSSLFHLAFVVAAVGLALLRARRGRRRLATAAGVALALLIVLYAKNLMLVGSFGASSWLGMNFARMTLLQVPVPERAALVQAGVLSPVALVRPFAGLALYPPEYRDAAGFPDVPALQRTRKLEWHSNYNHAAYPRIARQYWRDALALLRHRPTVLLSGLRQSWSTYFRPSEDHEYLEPVPALRRFAAAYNRIALADVGGLALALVIGLPAVTAYGVGRAVARSGGRADDPVEAAVFAHAAFVICYVAVVGNLFDVGENNRFRFASDPLAAVLLAALLQSVVRRWRRSAAPPVTPSGSS